MHNENRMNPLSKVIKFEKSDGFYYEYKTFDSLSVDKSSTVLAM